MIQASCSAQCLVFSEVFDAQLREDIRDGVNEWLEDGLFIVANDENFLDFGDVCDCAKAVLNDGVTCDREEGLLRGQRM